MEDLRVSLQSARHSFLQTVTGCFDSSSLMTVLTHSATPSTFPHSLHLPFVQGGESTATKRVFKKYVFAEGEEDSGGEIDKFEVKLSRRKNWITEIDVSHSDGFVWVSID
uniref:Uncharacterized protein n=1 Tax=Brassica oleracea var. oleracea TaxID=109376 RepID=A0A0D3CH39_BRAOL